MKKIMILGVFLLSILSVSAYDFEVEGVYYEILSTSELTCEVTSGAEKYVGDIKIPTVVNYKNRELSVVSIGPHAFRSCCDLTSVSIPGSVTSIRYCAFSECTGLTSVVIPSSVTFIGDNNFSGCTGLTSVVIPSSVTGIGSCAFSGCTGLTSVVIPSSVRNIEYDAFSGCTGLTSVSIPGSVNTIDGLAFAQCSNLKDVTFECSPSTLDFKKYQNYNYYDTFKDCNSLTKIGIGRKISLSGKNIFGSLSEIIPRITDITDLVILDGVDLYYFFYWNDLKKNLTTLELGKDITNFGVYRMHPLSFSDYSKLETIICKDPIPTPDCPTFSKSQYIDNIKVYVPQGSLEAYQKAEGWKNFWNIIEMGESGIDSVIGDSECKEIGRYNLQGRKVSADYKGVVIVKYSDGTAKKIISDGSAR